MSNLTREIAFIPLLGSSNGLFLAITTVGSFFLFLHGTGARRGPKHFIFHIIFARKSHLKQLELNNDLLGHAVVKICSF